jgi:hypothetical protein
MYNSYFTMDIPNVYKFKADNIVSIVGGARCSLGKAVNIKHGCENCEETQQLKIRKVSLYNYSYVQGCQIFILTYTTSARQTS